MSYTTEATIAYLESTNIISQKEAAAMRAESEYALRINPDHPEKVITPGDIALAMKGAEALVEQTKETESRRFFEIAGSFIK